MSKRKLTRNVNAFLATSLVASVVIPTTIPVVHAEESAEVTNLNISNNEKEIVSNSKISSESQSISTEDTVKIEEQVESAEFISVADAIANNSGIATVRGYIVGTAISGTKYDQEAPFDSNTNLGLADDPNETDPAKILPVQLTKGEIREVLNLKENPEYFQIEVTITGSLEPYFSVPGLKSPSTYSIVGQEPEPEVPETPLETISILEARTLGSGEVKVKGTVTAKLKNTLHIQDSTGAIAIYPSSINAQIGDEIIITGTLDDYNGLLQLQNPTIAENIGQVTVPAPLYITGAELNEENESKLVTVENVTLESVNGSSWKNYTATDGTQFTVRDELGTLDLSVGTTYESITGIVQEFNGVFQIIPRNQADILEDSSVVQAVTANPAPGLIPTGTEVTLSTLTDGADIYFTIDGSDPTEEGQLYDEPVVVNDDMNIKAVAIKEGLTSSQVTEFTYTVYNQEEGMQIHDIQGESHNSSLDGTQVQNIQGIVTYQYELGGNHYFHIQTPDDLVDGNPNTSEGIVVFTGNQKASIQVGNLVSVTGTVDEYHIDGYYDTKQDTDLSVTQINARNDRGGKIEVLENNVALPEPVVINASNLPSEVIDNDGFVEFDPQEDAIDFWESLEGMRVEVGTVKAVAPQEHGDLITVLEDRVTDTINGGVLLKEDNANADRIQFKLYDNDAARDFEVATGDKFEGPIQGVVNYGFQNYKIYADYEDMKAKHVVGAAEPETTTIVKDDNKLTIASYNLENFSNNTSETSNDKAQKLARAFVTDMQSPDIIGVTEVQDNNGQDSGNAEASESYERLIQAIEDAGGPRYEYLNIDPIVNEDGGAPNANIRVGFLYNPDRVSLPEGIQAGNATTAVGYEDGQLTHNPGRIDPDNDAFYDSRKPLAAQFNFQGEEVIVIANHWNSKSGDTPLFGSTQPPVYGSEEQRHKIANVVYSFIEDIKTKNPDANIVSVGDFNDFQFSETLKIQEGELMTNMINHVEESDRYTYLYQGNSQVLDHILVSNNLVDNTEIDILHINADFTDMAGRASDHDPVMVQIDLKAKEVPAVEQTFNLQNYDTNQLIINKPSVALKLDNESEIPEGILFTGDYAEIEGNGFANTTLTIRPDNEGTVIDLKGTLVKEIIVEGPYNVQFDNQADGQIIDQINDSFKFTILSDTHFYDKSLGTTGEALENYLANDRKLLIESEEILEAAVQEIKFNDSEVVLISGDLTKDGELIGHQNVAKILEELEAAGKKVYVTHGNHDINNPHAVKFVDGVTEAVDTVTVKEYKELYNDFGYGEAIAQDPNSLSYVVQPKKGVRIIVMDSALYENNFEIGRPETDGEFSDERLTWILDQIKAAKENGDFVFGMTHHGIIQHFGVQDQIFPQYVINNWENVSTKLADAGLNIVFTGHFHAQDAVKKTTESGNVIYDIETGSLVTYPAPYRVVEIANGIVKVDTETVDKIAFDTNGKPFPEYAEEFLVKGMETLVPSTLAQLLESQGLPPELAEQQAQAFTNMPVVPEVDPSITLGDIITDALVQHYTGDEKANPITEGVVNGLQNSEDPMQRFLGNALFTLYNDDTTDNQFEINLNSLNK